MNPKHLLLGLVAFFIYNTNASPVKTLRFKESNGNGNRDGIQEMKAVLTDARLDTPVERISRALTEREDIVVPTKFVGELFIIVDTDFQSAFGGNNTRILEAVDDILAAGNELFSSDTLGLRFVWKRVGFSKEQVSLSIDQNGLVTARQFVGGYAEADAYLFITSYENKYLAFDGIASLGEACSSTRSSRAAIMAYADLSPLAKAHKMQLAGVAFSRAMGLLLGMGKNRNGCFGNIMDDSSIYEPLIDVAKTWSTCNGNDFKTKYRNERQTKNKYCLDKNCKDNDNCAPLRAQVESDDVFCNDYPSMAPHCKRLCKYDKWC